MTHAQVSQIFLINEYQNLIAEIERLGAKARVFGIDVSDLSRQATRTVEAMNERLLLNTWKEKAA